MHFPNAGNAGSGFFFSWNFFIFQREIYEFLDLQNPSISVHIITVVYDQTDDFMCECEDNT